MTTSIPAVESARQAPRSGEFSGPSGDAHAAVQAMRLRLNRTLRGKSEVVESVLTCLLAQGHLLIEDKPGLGKTTLAKSLAEAIGGRFARVQCTPDLLPSDVTGFNIFNQKTHEFAFHPGPVFSDLLLADEINRATPRTQSALLEAMAERQVTVDGVRMPLAPQFFVIATQNPTEQHGTYPLPEAQLDRFAMKLSVGYPVEDDEVLMLQDGVGEPADGQAGQIPDLLPGQLAELQAEVQRIPVARSIQQYLVRVASATRGHARVLLGISPRGLLLWQRVAQARAWLSNRDFVTPDDARAVAGPVLGVRLVTDHEDARPVIRELLASVPVPEYSVVGE
ncbi:MAG: MoxR family ATPase [Planctomycetaceae bacterium]